MPTSFRDHARSLTEIELAESLEHHAALTASATAQAVMEEAAARFRRYHYILFEHPPYEGDE